MNIFMYIINNILGQAVFVIGLVVVIGLVAQKTPIEKIVSSTIKTMIGFMLVNTGGQTLGMALLPLQPMLIKLFNLSVTVPDMASAQGTSMEGIGSEMALIFAFGFLTNILLARFTKFK